MGRPDRADHTRLATEPPRAYCLAAAWTPRGWAASPPDSAPTGETRPRCQERAPALPSHPSEACPGRTQKVPTGLQQDFPCQAVGTCI